MKTMRCKLCGAFRNRKPCERCHNKEDGTTLETKVWTTWTPADFNQSAGSYVERMVPKRNRLVLRGKGVVYFSVEDSAVECDFCGSSCGKTKVFTSEVEVQADHRKINTQICFRCVEVLYKLTQPK